MMTGSFSGTFRDFENVRQPSNQMALYRQLPTDQQSNDQLCSLLDSIDSNDLLSDIKPFRSSLMDESDPLWSRESNLSRLIPSTSSISRPMYTPFTIEEDNSLRRLVALERESRESAPIDMPVSDGLFRGMRSGQSLPFSAMEQGYNTCVNRIRHFLKSLDPDRNFNHENFHKLSLDMVVNIKAARFLNPKNSLQAQLSYVNFPDQHSNYIKQQSTLVPLQKNQI